MFARKSIDTISIYFLMNDKNNKAKKISRWEQKKRAKRNIHVNKAIRIKKYMSILCKITFLLSQLKPKRFKIKFAQYPDYLIRYTTYTYIL